MGSEWKEVKLEQIAVFKNGKKIDENERKANGRYYIYGSNGIIGKTDKFLVCNDCIIIGRVGAYCGSLQYSKGPSWVTDNAIFCLTNKDTDLKFLFYVLKTIPIRDMAGGSAQPLINQEILNNITITCPPLPEQQKIASILSAFDDKIELNNEMNKTLEEIAQAIFKHWFIDFEFPNENGEPYKSSGGEFVDSELGPIPKGWRINTIRDICKNNTAITGKTPPTRVKENYGDYMMFITIPDMHGNVFVINTQKKLSRIGANSQKNKTLPPLSICVSCIATPGLVCLTSEPSQTNQQINSIVCKENISPYYIFSLMKNYRTHIINLGSGGTATLNLNKRDFEKIKIIIPETKNMKVKQSTFSIEFYLTKKKMQYYPNCVILCFLN
jgi:type I restriction enzyme S subunit